MTLQLYEDDVLKKELLNVSDLSPVEQKYTLSALKIFKERYLLKDNSGNIVERLDDLFKRVAVASGIMDVLYSPRWYNKGGEKYSGYLPALKQQYLANEAALKDLDYKDINNKSFKIGQFTVNVFHIQSLLARYIELYEEGKITTTFENILYFIRDYDRKEYVTKSIEEKIQRYYELMCNGVFLPNTPCLMNAGTKLNQNAACFTLDIEDDLEDIYKTYSDIAKVFKSGGGIGINYSKLRPEGAFIKSTGGKSSGTISWLKGTDETTGRVAQGGKRRGAAMGILNMNHPEIDKFINLKDNKTLENHNISICTPSSFFQNLFNGEQLERERMNRIVQNVWNTGDPGMVFLENMNANNLLYPLFDRPIDVTNPCSEISMYPYDSCILASINLSKFLFDGKFDLEEFINVTRDVTYFLDGIVDAGKYPLPEINEMTKNCRRIGVGYMGLADTMAQLEIPYNSQEGFIFCEYITAVLSLAALLESNSIAKTKGSFPLWYSDKYPKSKLPVKALYTKDLENFEENCPSVEKYLSYRFHEDKDPFLLIAQMIDAIKPEEGMRNCSVTTVAPTGTLSMMADCSSGIEPLFSLGYTKKVTLGEFDYVDKNLVILLKRYGIYSPSYVHEIVKELGGTLGKAEQKSVLPEKVYDLAKILITAMEIHPYDHIMMQASAQRWITNGISKTINAPFDVDRNLIEYSYVLSWALGNKGITVFRDRCKDVQVLNSAKTISGENLRASEYTISQIRLLNDVIPKEYKDQMILGADPEMRTKHYLNISKDDIKETLYEQKTKMKLECSNCNNVIYKDFGRACFICSRCGNSMGSCSS